MKNTRIISAMIITYMFYAILLNSVGAVISQSILSFGISKSDGSVLEGFKDISIVIISFIVSSFLPRFGYRRALIISLIAVSLVCLLMPILPSFNAIKGLFFVIGVTFAMVKVAVYSSIGLLTDDTKKHAGITSTVEGFFMVGVLGGAWVFALFIDAHNGASLKWLNVYYWLGITGLVAAFLWSITPLPPSNELVSDKSWTDDLKLIPSLFVLNFLFSFIAGIFLYVLVEQSLGTWLPTYNREVLNLSPAMAIQIGSIFAASSALGRLLGGIILRKTDWLYVLLFCVVGTASMIIIAMQMPHSTTIVTSWLNAPIQAYILPLAGFFLSPIYPTINSIALSSLPKEKHAPMMGLIIAFSALGGTLGSFITGQIFGHIGGTNAFYMTLIPLILLFGVLILLKSKLKHSQ